jgi:hypothetical protein
MQDITVARLQTPLSPSFKCNVLRESLSVDSQNIPCATLKEKGVVGNLYISLSLGIIHMFTTTIVRDP